MSVERKATVFAGFDGITWDSLDAKGRGSQTTFDGDGKNLLKKCNDEGLFVWAGKSPEPNARITEVRYIETSGTIHTLIWQEYIQLGRPELLAVDKKVAYQKDNGTNRPDNNDIIGNY